MKLSALLLTILFGFQAYAADIAIIGEAPNADLDFVDDMVEEYIKIDSTPREHHSTKWLSVLSKTSVDRVAFVEVDTKKLNYDKIVKPLEAAAQASHIVLSSMTPRDGFLCLQMKKQTETLFVLPAGDSSVDLNVPGVGVKWCNAPNLLFVAALKSGNRLLPTSNFGHDYVRVAALGDKVKITNEAGRRTVWTSSLASAAIVAAQVSKYSKRFPRLKGYKLAHSFLNARTRSHKNLSKKVRGGKAVLRNSYRN